MLRAQLSRIAILTVLLVGVACDRVIAQQPAVGIAIDREHQLKAAFLYNFSRYVRWPETAFADANSPFVIGIMNADALTADLNHIARTKKADGRTIVIRRLTAADQVATCHVVFISGLQEPKQMSSLNQAVGDRAVLLVGDSPGFCAADGAISFFVENNNLRFEINLETAKRRQLSLNANLIKLGQVYRKP